MIGKIRSRKVAKPGKATVHTVGSVQVWLLAGAMKWNRPCKSDISVSFQNSVTYVHDATVKQASSE